MKGGRRHSVTLPVAPIYEMFEEGELSPVPQQPDINVDLIGRSNGSPVGSGSDGGFVNAAFVGSNEGLSAQNGGNVGLNDQNGKMLNGGKWHAEALRQNSFEKEWSLESGNTMAMLDLGLGAHMESGDDGEEDYDDEPEITGSDIDIHVTPPEADQRL